MRIHDELIATLYKERAELLSQLWLAGRLEFTEQGAAGEDHEKFQVLCGMDHTLEHFARKNGKEENAP